MRRRQPRSGLRDELAGLERIMVGYAVRLGMSGPRLERFTARLVALGAGLPVVVQHGWQVDLPAVEGPLLLLADGSVEPLTEVYADPDAQPRTVSHYMRADGSVA